MLRQSLGLLLCLPLLTACGTGYLLQAGRGEWQLLRARQPIARVLQDPAADPALKQQLQEAQAARDFAVSALLLPDNASYRSFSALRRPYVVWNVVAAPEFSLTPLRWCFPIAGCISYRGYFREAAARRYAERLQRAGYDTQVGGVAAFSTLGRFADPVLDTMLRYGAVELAGTIFHELAHQRLYVAGDSEFNEAFATAVEELGLRAWLQRDNRGEELHRLEQRRGWHEALQGVLAAGRSELAALYARQLPAAEARSAKRDVLATVAERLRALQQQLGFVSGYNAWLESGLNNAHLAAIATYHECVPAFRGLHAEAGGDWSAFYAAARQIARRSPAGRREFCAAGRVSEPPLAVSAPRR